MSDDSRDGRVTVQRLAFGTLVVLAAALGLGDIAWVTTFDTFLLIGIRGLLPLAIVLALLDTLLRRHMPAFPSQLAGPALAWLTVLVAAAASAPTNHLDALASLERPASGALLTWAVWHLCRTEARWRLLAQTAAFGGLGIAVIGLAEAGGVPSVRNWLSTMHGGTIPIGDVPRITSTLSHPNEAAMLLEMSLPLLVAWALTVARRWRVPLTVAATCNLAAMVLTFSRAGVVAGMAGLAIMAWLCLVRGDRRALVSLGGVALAVPAALLYAAMANQGLDRRLTAELPQPSATTIQHAPLASDVFDPLIQPATLSSSPTTATPEPLAIGGEAASHPAPAPVVTPENSPSRADPSVQQAQSPVFTLKTSPSGAALPVHPARSPVLTPGTSSRDTDRSPGLAQSPVLDRVAPADERVAPDSDTPSGAALPLSTSSPEAAPATDWPAFVAAPPSRVRFWTAAIDMARDHPWLGVGPDNFRWRFADYSGVLANNLGVHAHNQYVEALADTGVFGLVTLGWVLLTLFRTALERARRAESTSADWPWRAAILASLSAWLLHALLDDFERFWPASVAFWLLAGLNLRLPRAAATPPPAATDAVPRRRQQIPRTTANRAVVSICLLREFETGARERHRAPNGAEKPRAGRFSARF